MLLTVGIIACLCLGLKQLGLSLSVGLKFCGSGLEILLFFTSVENNDKTEDKETRACGRERS